MEVIALWVFFAMTMGGGVLLLRRMGRSGHSPGTQITMGLGIGLVAAFVLVAMQADLVPDEVEWVGIAGILAIAGAALVLLFVGSLAE